MEIDDWTTRQRWLYAIKPASWPKLLVPMALGQAAGIVASGAIDLRAVLFGFVFTILDGLFIVLLNDWGDQHVDRIKRKMFPDGCSPKTIPDGILPAGKVLAGGLAAGVAAFFAAWLAGNALGLAWLPLAALVCLGLFVAYSLPPLRLNYRGGGEVLEMFGVGVALPWINAYAQAGEFWADSYDVFVGFALLSLASALASGLSDEESDLEGGKTTFTTTYGNEGVRRATNLCLQAGVVMWLYFAFTGTLPIVGTIAASSIVILHRQRMQRVSPRATTNAFGELKRYKLHLHHAIWYGGLTMAAAMLAHTMLF